MSTVQCTLPMHPTLIYILQKPTSEQTGLNICYNIRVVPDTDLAGYPAKNKFNLIKKN